ncbi:FAD-dependent oxidoreductase [Staphylococcus simulans]|uniref:FAD-dependent oxidoreductase n=1 Tax=Staphylococcus simulans TaxID=1286 RepID=UPI000D1ECBF6|nr:FAD-dependent oxidoreductase [Staphylococcus simulans]MDQ7112745.1 FAD-dependent oxidoreductase [Staphylococcus simulans]MDQ7116593.1 FAD-dependent oxidoreductase [Staphylococcus simulans]PTI86054.1 CoA-disulfide reductase [Staphylococcus simulans]RIN50791.1 CoA-disulfide reductase [Staphylococcus simulans]UXR52867.1 FAD-dependent oxidoreductase [Staphylococcus simulans]
MKYVIVGTSHAGYAAIETLLISDPEAEIEVFESADKPSFLSCGIQSYLEDVAPSLDSLHYASVESLENRGVKVHVNTTVTDLDTENKTVTVQDKDNNESKVDYDKLFLSPGGVPNAPPIDGINDYNNVLFMRGADWAGKIKERMKSAKKAIVVGGGYIGIEAAEAFVEAGIDTTVMDDGDRLIKTYLDKEFTDILEENAKEHGLKFRGNENVKALKADDNNNVTGVVTDNGEFEADTVIFTVGVKPATEWLDGKVKLGTKGIIEINDHLETSEKDVYASGDATMIPYAPIEEERYIALATNSRRQGYVAARNMAGHDMKMPRVSGTSGLSLFDYKFGQTGVHESEKDNYEGNLGATYIEVPVRPKFRQDDTTVHLKIIYDEDSHRILGGQIMSKEDLVESINTISVAINAGWKLEDLALVDFFFQPNFDRPWNYLNVLAQRALGDDVFPKDNQLF